MKKLLKPAAFALAGVLLFALAFLGFAWVRVESPHELPLVGGLFPQPAAESEPATAAAPANHAASPAGPVSNRAGLGLLDVFRIDSPLDAGELAALAGELKARLAALESREAQQAEREARLAERALFLDEQFAMINGLRTELERWQTELEQRQAAIGRDESAQAERDAESWTRMAKLFEKGEARSLAKKLEAYPPDQAARILSQLKPDRARELLEGLGGEAWKDYWEAYRRALGTVSDS
jgi:hypothetical protein